MYVLWNGPCSILVSEDLTSAARTTADLLSTIAEIVNLVGHDPTSAAWAGSYNPGRGGFRRGSSDKRATGEVISTVRGVFHKVSMGP